MPRLVAALSLAAACSRPTSSPPPTGGTTETVPPPVRTTLPVESPPTHAWPRPTLLEGACAADDNPLRFTCAVSVEPPQPVEVRFARVDGAGDVRVHRSAAIAREHEIPLYFLGPEHDYLLAIAASDWPVDPQVLTVVRTGAPPFDVASRLAVTGASSVSHVGTDLPCGTSAVAVVYDTETGDLVWYQDLDPEGTLGLVDMVRFADDHTIYGETDEHLAEVDLLGATVTEFDVPLGEGGLGPHHDVFRWNEQYYFLYQYEVRPWLTLDALAITDRAGTVLRTWFPDSVLPIPEDARGDYLHTNSIHVDDAGDVYLNFLNLRTFLKIRGEGPDFGEPQWIMAPGGAGELGNDFVVDWSAVDGPDDVGFQHHLHPTLDGRLMLLDNAGGRGLALSYDAAAHIAKVDAAYPPFEPVCGPQGTAMDTPAGGVVVACDTDRVREYDMETADLTWEAVVTCDNGGGDGRFARVFATRWYPLADW